MVSISAASFRTTTAISHLTRSFDTIRNLTSLSPAKYGSFKRRSSFSQWYSGTRVCIANAPKQLQPARKAGLTHDSESPRTESYTCAVFEALRLL